MGIVCKAILALLMQLSIGAYLFQSLLKFGLFLELSHLYGAKLPHELDLACFLLMGDQGSLAGVLAKFGVFLQDHTQIVVKLLSFAWVLQPMVHVILFELIVFSFL